MELRYGAAVTEAEEMLAQGIAIRATFRPQDRLYGARR